MVDSNIKSTSEKETLYVIPFVKDTFWSKDYKEVLQMFNDLQIPLRNIICVESTDIVTESNFDRSFYKKIYELSGITFIKTNLVDGDSISLKGFNTVEIVIKNRLKEKDYNVKIIMNPPYKRDLHLKVLNQMLITFPNSEIVNLSPIGWLQDLLADIKQGTEFKKFGCILKHLSKLDLISKRDANKYFGVKLRSDLAIYHFTKEGGFDIETFRLGTPEKKLSYKLATEVFPKYERFTKDMDFSKEFKFNFPDSAGNAEKGLLFAMNKKTAFAYRGTDPNETYVKVSFDTSVERDNFYSSLCTNLFKFIVIHIRRGFKVNVTIQFLPHFLNVKWEGKSGTIDGYKNPITDEMLYEYFELTDEEINTIENFFKGK